MEIDDDDDDDDGDDPEAMCWCDTFYQTKFRLTNFISSMMFWDRIYEKVKIEITKEHDQEHEHELKGK